MLSQEWRWSWSNADRPCSNYIWVINNSFAYKGAPLYKRFDGIFKHILEIKFMSTCAIALRWMPRNNFDDRSTLAQVMAWCRQATSHYLSQCWPRFISPYGFTSSQWVNTCHLEFNLVNMEIYGAGNRNTSLPKSRTYLFCIFNIMVAQSLTTQWARASTSTQWVNTCHLEFNSANMEIYGAANRNPSLWKSRTYLFCIFNTMVAESLTTQRARASAAMALT